MHDTQIKFENLDFTIEYGEFYIDGKNIYDLNIGIPKNIDVDLTNLIGKVINSGKNNYGYTYNGFYQSKCFERIDYGDIINSKITIKFKEDIGNINKYNEIEFILDLCEGVEGIYYTKTSSCISCPNCRICSYEIKDYVYKHARKLNPTTNIQYISYDNDLEIVDISLSLRSP